jgi:uncharacterized protein YpmS
MRLLCAGSCAWETEYITPTLDDGFSAKIKAEECIIAAMRKIGLMKTIVATTLLLVFSASSALSQDSQTAHMAWCAKLAEANMKATRDKSPEVARTIESYLFEYSERHHTCVAVMAYRVQQKDQVQILARNMVTLQPMKGLTEIFLKPASDKQGIIDAINFLFAEYSK